MMNQTDLHKKDIQEIKEKKDKKQKEKVISIWWGNWVYIVKMIREKEKNLKSKIK